MFILALKGEAFPVVMGKLGERDKKKDIRYKIANIVVGMARERVRHNNGESRKRAR